MNIIRNCHLSLGLALGSSCSNGNLLQLTAPTLHLIFSILSLIIIVLLTIKFIDNFKSLTEEMKKPVIATVLANIPNEYNAFKSIFKKYMDYIVYLHWIIRYA